VTFGLGAEKTAARLEVVWPDGGREAFAGLPGDRVFTIARGAKVAGAR